MGEMSKVEEVVRIVAMDMCDQWHREGEFTLDEVNGDTLDRAMTVASKAIEALRDANLVYAVLEPRTEADEIAGRREFYGDSGAWLSLWNSAIDAALKE